MTPPIAQNDASHKSGQGEPIAVTRCGRWAHAALTASGSGRVIAVFRRSFYIETLRGLVCVGPVSLGDGPLNALCELSATHDWQSAGVAEGNALDCRRFSLGMAEAWRPQPISGATLPADLGARIRRVSDVARTYARTDGFCPLVADAARADGLLLRTARRPIDDLVGWLGSGAGGDLVPPPPSALRLLGLGPGLTPSGDDYLGGVLISLHAAGRAGSAAALAKLVVPEAPARTSRISAAHLACAAEGEGAAALHETISALLGASGISLEDCLRAIDSIGHSSGWDALAGALAMFRSGAG
jgi:hypothetical protein